MYYHDHQVEITLPPGISSFSVGNTNLTSMGQELYKIAGRKPSEAYLAGVMSAWLRNGTSSRVL